MFFIPTWVTNIVFLITCWVSGFQHLRLRRPNPVTNLQFFMMAFSLIMILIVALYNRENPWLSLAFFVLAIGCLSWMIRQLRMLPPMKPIE
ncbi:hypothetical protein [Rhodopila sp.]|uniref:hypothetical protein n=1 Tax=Rhodopila sp. TaxID=2480087 RepID=UPI003D1506A3